MWKLFCPGKNSLMSRFCCIMTEHTDPNGRVHNVDERWEFENNTFAILDVDGAKES